MNELIIMGSESEMYLAEKEKNSDKIFDAYLQGSLINIKNTILNFIQLGKEAPNDPTLKSTILENFRKEQKRIIIEIDYLFK